MKKELQFALSPEEADDEIAVRKVISETLDISAKDSFSYKIIKRSIDARSRNIKINLRVDVFINELSPEIEYIKTYSNISNKKSVIIIGAGPAGLFAALQLIENGLKPIVIERGKSVKERRRDLAAINKEHIVNPHSNYCFGEGGAGTYSDGKLYTRSTKRGDVNNVLETFIAHGADENIIIDAHPHIGTNKLPKIIEAMRQTIINAGGEVHFNTHMVDIIIQQNCVKGIVCEHLDKSEKKEFLADDVILATGHSARDIFELLASKKIVIESKPFAMGVRIEHPQELIDSIQYHCAKEEVYNRREHLPAASYSLVHQAMGRGVYSFCMCPGGIIAPCATAQNEIVVNGWSPSKRNNPYANSGIVVSTEAEDLRDYLKHGDLAGLRYQQKLENEAWIAGGKTQAAPAQRLVDFINNKYSQTLPGCSYQPGIKSVEMQRLLPYPISKRLQEGFKAFGSKMKGYLTNEAIIVGVESRTSSPVRIPRDKDSLQHPQIKGLYPCGEGAGYAGGIVSAAIDGQKSAAAIAARYLD